MVETIPTEILSELSEIFASAGRCAEEHEASILKYASTNNITLDQRIMADMRETNMAFNRIRRKIIQAKQLLNGYPILLRSNEVICHFSKVFDNFLKATEVMNGFSPYTRMNTTQISQFWELAKDALGALLVLSNNWKNRFLPSYTSAS